jgi:hypothetical protein
MPNWCSGRATISGPAPVISEIKSILENPEGDLLNWMVPRPKSEDENWYAWNIENWGTKWSLSDVYIDNGVEEDSIEFSFSTAWAPPVDAFRTWAEQDGRVQFTLEYWEPGCAFVGSANYDGDYLDDDYIDGNQDIAAYRSRASADWGYEEWEEPEPLTEWYKQGVEDKGLEK